MVLTCAYCNKEIRDDAYKVKEGDKEYTSAARYCQKGMEQKIETLKARV